MLSIIFSSSRKLTCTWLQIEQICIRQVWTSFFSGSFFCKKILLFPNEDDRE
jgi:hypothetical protein